MGPYAQAISEAIGRTDPETLALVEDIMRDGRSGLDGLCPVAFRREARQAWEDVRGLHETGQLAMYCRALGLALPRWVG